MIYEFENKFQKIWLTGAYFLKHPNKKEVTDEELNDWLVGIYIEEKYEGDKGEIK